tara:strand:- start:5553 stop:6206 length:654 start_codon:yes stop_codon:yes gene_type:complete
VKEKPTHNGIIGWIRTHIPKAWLRVLAFSIAVAVGSIFTNFEKWDLKQDIRKCATKNETLEGENVKMQAEIRNIRRDQEKIKNSLLLLSMSEDNYPAPKWLKSVDGVMLRLNKAYEKEFLLPFDITRDDYIGHTDFEIWPHEVAKKFREKDQMVIRSGEPITDIETVEYPDGTKENLEVTKYPWTINGTVFGVAGYVDVDFYKGYKVRRYEQKQSAE